MKPCLAAQNEHAAEHSRTHADDRRHGRCRKWPKRPKKSSARALPVCWKLAATLGASLPPMDATLAGDAN
ncbi:MAG: hypothetical protein ACKVS5_10750 [Parvularculaceae bacterium]